MNFVHFQTLLHWINERERARLGYESGAKKPWTTDAIIQQYRFCNVRRQDDKVTKWLAKNWYPHWESPNFFGAIALARLFNLPATLEEMEFPVQWDMERMMGRVYKRRSTGAQVFNAAYIVSTCGKSMDKVDYVFRIARDLHKLDGKQWASLEAAFNDITKIDGLGAGFLAGQIIADLKYTPHLAGKWDWHIWCSRGPGSQRGLNRLCGMDINTRWPSLKFGTWVDKLRLQLEDHGIKIHCQDVQNCLCELDKYMRALEGGRPKQHYPGR